MASLMPSFSSVLGMSSYVTASSPTLREMKIRCWGTSVRGIRGSRGISSTTTGAGRGGCALLR